MLCSEGNYGIGWDNGQAALLYPPNRLYFVLSAPAALNAYVLMHFCIAGLCMYGYLRLLALGRVPALAGAVVFMFCGSMTARVLHYSMLSGTALVPLLFLCVERALRAGGARWLALAAIAVAFQALAGHPQLPVYTALALGLYVLAQALAAFGLQGVIEPRQRCEPGRPRPGLLLLAAAIALLPLSLKALAWAPGFQASLELPARALQLLQSLSPAAVVPIGLSFFSAALLAWWSHFPARAGTQVLALLLVLLDMGVHAASFNPPTARQYYEDALDDERLLRPESPILNSLNVKYLLVPVSLRPSIGGQSLSENFQAAWRR